MAFEMNRKKAFEILKFTPKDPNNQKDKNPEFNIANLKTAYKKMALKTHPDKVKDDGETFKAVGAAFEFLMNELTNPYKNVQNQRRRNGSTSHYSSFTYFRMNVTLRNHYSKTTMKPYFVSLNMNGFKEDCRDQFEHQGSHFIRLAEVTITNDDLKLPPNGAQMVLESLIKNPYVIKISVPSGFFNTTQQIILNNHLNENRKKPENQETFIKMRWTSKSVDHNNITEYKIDKPGELKKVFGVHLLFCPKTIHISEAKLPPNGAQIILDILKGYSSLLDVDVPKDFFNARQQSELDQHLAKNKKAKAEKYNFKINLHYKTRVGDDSDSHHLFGKSEQALEKDCKIIYVNQPFHIHEITIYGEKIKISANGKQILLESLEKNSHLIKVNVPDGFFNKEQSARLKKHIAENNRKIAEKIAVKKAAYKANVNDCQYKGKACTLEFSIEHRNGGLTTSKYIGGEKELINLCDQYFSEKKYTSHISLSKVKLPKRGINILLEKIKNNHSLIDVKVPVGLFNTAQKNELKRHLKKNRNRKRDFQSRWYLWGAIVAPLMCSAIGLGVVAILSSIVVGAIAGKTFSIFRDYYLNLMGRKYNTTQKIDAITNESTRDALKAGERSKYWKGYIVSYLNYKNYTNYRGFCEGQYAGMHADKTLIKKIKAH